MYMYEGAVWLQMPSSNVNGNKFRRYLLHAMENVNLFVGL